MKVVTISDKNFYITEHGNLYGAVEFYKKARAAGIKPILGVKVMEVKVMEVGLP